MNHQNHPVGLMNLYLHIEHISWTTGHVIFSSIWVWQSHKRYSSLLWKRVGIYNKQNTQKIHWIHATKMPVLLHINCAAGT